MGTIKESGRWQPQQQQQQQQQPLQHKRQLQMHPRFQYKHVRFLSPLPAVNPRIPGTTRPMRFFIFVRPS